MTAANLRNLVLNLIVMLLSLSIHEFAHAWTADRLGDDTPRRQGRLTLSPLAHYDLFGTILLPVVSSLTLGYSLIGWAKPVQFVPANLTPKISMRAGIALVAAAGPLSNLAFAALAAAALSAQLHGSPAGPEPASVSAALQHLLASLLFSNVALCVFNLLPIPPLDGSRLLPRSLDALQARIAPYSFLVLLVVLGIPEVGRILIQIPVQLLIGVLLSVFGLEFWGVG